jgi:hypothetical protein
MLEPTTEPTAADTRTETIRQFLADRDVACPGCGYNLRGIEQATCPECGRGIELTIRRPGRGRGYLLFVLLALGWVLIAGTMNGVRAWRVVCEQAQPPQTAFLTLSRVMAVRTSGSITSITTGPNGTSFTVNGTTITPRVLQPVPTPGLAWGNVATRTWVSLGWWSALGLIALTILIVAIVGRRRFDRDRLPNVTIASACVLFTLYAGYHAVTFTREML